MSTAAVKRRREAEEQVCQKSRGIIRAVYIALLTCYKGAGELTYVCLEKVDELIWGLHHFQYAELCISGSLVDGGNQCILVGQDSTHRLYYPPCCV